MKDWLVRALKTFVQTTAAYLMANVTVILTHLVEWNFTDWKGWLLPIIVGAGSAGISAVWNIILEKLNERKSENNGSID